MTTNTLRRLPAIRLALAYTALVACVASAHAEDANPVLAKVDGVEIRRADVTRAAKEIGPQAAGADEARMVSALIDMKLLLKEAAKRGLADRDEFKARLAFTRDTLLMNEVVAEAGKAAATDEAVRKAYEEGIKKLSGEQEVHARHILVETEDEAKAVVEDLKKGADFAELAGKKSKDAASKGGDLGFFVKEQMVPEFAAAAFALEPGKISDPVKSKFGWHVIKVEEKRDRKAPEFASVKPQLEGFVAKKAQAEFVEKLRAAAKIERFEAKPEAAAETKPSVVPPKTGAVKPAK